MSMIVLLLELSPEVFEAAGFCCFDLADGSVCVESRERGGGELAGGDCAVPRSDKSAIPAARIAGLSDIISILANGALARAERHCPSTALGLTTICILQQCRSPKSRSNSVCANWRRWPKSCANRVFAWRRRAPTR